MPTKGYKKHHFEQKICPSCNKIFSAKCGDSIKQWSGRIFCSRKCRYEFQKGKSQSEELKIKRGCYKLGKDAHAWRGGAKLRWARANQKRRHGLFGFIPLNNPEVDGWVAHHIDYDYVIFIPYELHHSIWHSIVKDINMDIINDKIYKWFIEYYLKGDLL